MSLNPAVDIVDLTVEYSRHGHKVRPFDNYSEQVQAGSLTLLLGPSGCGKTTLLSCIAGIQAPTSGSIVIEGVDITTLKPAELTDFRRRSIGVVFQAFNLVPSLSALENVMVPLRAAKVARAEAANRARSLLEDVGLGERIGHLPGTLSGGQMQRVAIARALALDPRLILADEPTASLDHVQVESVLRILRSLTARGHSVMVSTHDPRLLPLADYVIDLGPEHAPDAAAQVQTVFTAGEVIFAEGDPASHIYRVETGAVEFTREGQALRAVGPGFVFGEIGPLFGLPRSTSAVALEPTTLTAYTVEKFSEEFGRDELRRLVGRFGD